MKIDDRTRGAVKPQVHAQQWEYRSAKMDLDADLTQYGQEGWDLVAVVPVPYDPTSGNFYFRRRKQP